MKRKEASALDEKNRKLNARALKLAESQYDKIRQISKYTSGRGSSETENMSFDEFIKFKGIDSDVHRRNSNKRKREEDEYMEYEEEDPQKCRIPPHQRKQFREFTAKMLQDEYNKYQDLFLQEQDKDMKELGANVKYLLDVLKQQQQKHTAAEQKAEANIALTLCVFNTARIYT